MAKFESEWPGSQTGGWDASRGTVRSIGFFPGPNGYLGVTIWPWVSPTPTWSVVNPQNQAFSTNNIEREEAATETSARRPGLSQTLGAAHQPRAEKRNNNDTTIGQQQYVHMYYVWALPRSTAARETSGATLSQSHHWPPRLACIAASCTCKTCTVEREDPVPSHANVTHEHVRMRSHATRPDKSQHFKSQAIHINSQITIPHRILLVGCATSKGNVRSTCGTHNLEIFPFAKPRLYNYRNYKI